ncbi:MAG: NADH-quinone oxidoreductase subunit C [Zavarzinella sp.]
MTELLEQFRTSYPQIVVEPSQFRSNQRWTVPAEHLFATAQWLSAKGFDLLVDIAGIDYLQYPNATDRYGVVYALANTQTSARVFLKVMLNDPEPTVDSVYPIWKGADWLEREVYDMFGINFLGHPDLRRILLPEGFVSYPLRKDYPMRGLGERHNFESVIRSES